MCLSSIFQLENSKTCTLFSLKAILVMVSLTQTAEEVTLRSTPLRLGENRIGRGTCPQRCYGDLPRTLWRLKPERVRRHCQADFSTGTVMRSEEPNAADVVYCTNSSARQSPLNFTDRRRSQLYLSSNQPISLKKNLVNI